MMVHPLPSSDPRRGALGTRAVVLLVLIALVLLGGCAMVGKYNRIQSLDEGVDSAWAQVETVLQRRYDLIPNLVETVKGFAAQEKEVLTEVTELRSRWAAAGTPAEKAEAAGGLERALGCLLLVSERYPDLKSNQNFLALQSQLEGTENRISVERRRYNEALKAYNSYVRKFPQNLLGFDTREGYFESEEAAAEAPKVDFGGGGGA